MWAAAPRNAQSRRKGQPRIHVNLTDPPPRAPICVVVLALALGRLSARSSCSSTGLCSAEPTPCFGYLPAQDALGPTLRTCVISSSKIPPVG